MFNNTHQ